MPSNPFDLTGRTALITGGSKGLGKAMARGLAEQGANIVICSRHAEEAKAAIEEIVAGTKARGASTATDMCDRKQLDELAKFAIGAFGRVDILINNAGSNVPQPIDKIKDEDWDYIVELNLTSCALMCRAVVPQMKERRWGRIIHMSSVMGLGSKEARHSYSATKAALIGMARSGAIELGPFGVTVNCIAPGPFATDLPMSVLSKAEQDKFAERTSLGRWGDPQELVGPALLLASDAGSYITGTTLLVDGGTLCKTF